MLWFLGGPFDLMSRRIIAASSRAIGERIAKALQVIPLKRDDATNWIPKLHLKCNYINVVSYSHMMVVLHLESDNKIDGSLSVLVLMLSCVLRLDQHCK